MIRPFLGYKLHVTSFEFLSLKLQIESDLRSALKNRDTTTVSVLRMVLAAIKNKEIELMRGELGDEDILKVLKSERKKRLDSIEEFRKGQRMDLVSREESEVKIVETYLPAPMNVEEVKVLIETVKKEGITERGALIRETLKRGGNRVDGKIVSELIASSN